MRRVLVAGCLLLTVLLPATPALATDAAAAASGGGGGDFNGDGVADLAVGVPGEDVDGIQDAGAVNVLYGSATGITATGDQLFTQATPGVPGAAEAGDRFGSAVAAGDFKGTATTTWRWGCRWRTSAPSRTPARWSCCMARPPG